MKKFTFETGLFDEPARIDFVAIVATVDWITFVFGDFSIFIGKVDIFEKGAGAGFNQRVWQFVGANSRDNSADAIRTEVSAIVIGDVSFDGIIEWTEHLAGFEVEVKRYDEITIALGGIENALAIRKVKVGLGECFESLSGRIIDVDAFEYIRNLLTVGTDVLDGSGAGETWDFR